VQYTKLGYALNGGLMNTGKQLEQKIYTKQRARAAHKIFKLKFPRGDRKMPIDFMHIKSTIKIESYEVFYAYG